MGCNALPDIEAGDLLCDNHDDDDGDGLTDCFDPDCHAFEVCRALAEVDDPGDPPPLPAPDAGRSMPPSMPEPPDASVPDDDDMDAGADPMTPVDASLVEADGGMPAVCTPECGDDEFCNGGACETVGSGASGTFELTILSATVPDNNVIYQCYDIACLEGVSIPFALCMCPPGTYVKVARVRVGIVQHVGTTATAPGSLEPRYDESFDVELLPGDVLVFEVYDDDAPRAPTFIYSCSPDLTILEDGPISCMTPAGPPGEIYGVQAEIRAP